MHWIAGRSRKKIADEQKEEKVRDRALRGNENLTIDKHIKSMDESRLSLLQWPAVDTSDARLILFSFYYSSHFVDILYFRDGRWVNLGGRFSGRVEVFSLVRTPASILFSETTS